MNFIIKTAQMTIAFILMSGASQAAPPGNNTANKTLHINTTSCKIATSQDTCHIFKLEPSIELPSKPDTSRYKQIALNPKHPEKSESLTFNVITPQNGVSYTHGTLENKGFTSVSLGLSRVAHDESLDIVDSETSNEHAQVNVIIPLETIPTIEKYVQFFASSAYFTIAK